MTFAPQQIRDSSFNGVLFLWIFGILLIAVSIVMFVINLPLFLAFFAPIGLLLLLLATFFSFRSARYGRSVFDSPMLPAVCGGVLAGTIRLPKPLIYREPIHLQLVCIWQLRGTNSQPKLVWQDHCTLDRFPPNSPLSEIPVYFKVPPDAQPTSARTLWRLDARASAGVGRYSASFHIPVVSGAVPPAMRELADATAPLRSAEPPRRQPLGRHIHFSPLPAGGSRVELLPGRNFLCSLIPLVLGPGFTGAGSLVLFLLLKKSVENGPLLLGILFCGCGVMLFVFGLRLLLLKTTITVGDGMISVENSILFAGPRREIRAADIMDITVKMQGQLQNTPFYSLKARRNGARSRQICGTIYDKADADWLAAEFKRELQISHSPVLDRQ